MKMHIYCSSTYLSWGAKVSFFGGFIWVSQILQNKNHVKQDMSLIFRAATDPNELAFTAQQLSKPKCV